MKITIEIKPDKIDYETIAKIKLILHNAGYKDNLVSVDGGIITQRSK